MIRFRFSAPIAALLAAGLVGTLVSPVAAQPAPAGTIAVDPTAIIAGRQAAYDLMAADFGGMKAVIGAGGEVKPLERAAQAIEKWAGAIPGMFPPGTEQGHDTKARPNIWTDNAGFRTDAAHLAEAADQLAVAAKAGDKAAFAADYELVNKACGACHREYRMR